MAAAKHRGSDREKRRGRILRLAAFSVVLLFVAWVGYLLNQSNITYISLNGRTWKYREYRFADPWRVRYPNEAIIVMAIRALGYQRETMAYDPSNTVWSFRKEIIAQPAGPANGSRPVHSETNRTSSTSAKATVDGSAAGSRR